jgi:hypothetical protein
MLMISKNDLWIVAAAVLTVALLLLLVNTLVPQ